MKYLASEKSLEAMILSSNDGSSDGFGNISFNALETPERVAISVNVKQISYLSNF